MSARDFFSYLYSILVNLCKCAFKRTSLEEEFVQLSEQNVDPIIDEVVEPEDDDSGDEKQYEDLPELIPLETASNCDKEEYGSEKELDEIENSSEEYDNYYRD